MSFVFVSLCDNSVMSVQAAKAVNVSSTEKLINTQQSDIAHGIYDFNNSNNKNKKSSSTVMNNLASSNNLISFVQLTLTRSGSTLQVYGETGSDTDMAKIGFINITIQREENGSWQNYATWNSLYDYDSFVYCFGKYYDVPAGYNYRAIANHYAEKPSILWFKDTQTYYNETTVLYM